MCMGVVDGTKDGVGLEGSGVIRQVGANVNDLKIGDRVLVSEHGCFSTRLVTSSKLCAKIPDDLSFEEAATMPCVYSTVIYSLLTIGRLEKGQVRVSQHPSSDRELTLKQLDRANPVRLRRCWPSSDSNLQNDRGSGRYLMTFEQVQGS